MADSGRKTYELLMKIAGKVDTSLTSAMNQTKTSLKNVEKSAESLTAGLSKLVGFIGTALAVKNLAGALNDLAAKGDEAAKTARTLGMDVEAMQELAFAFGQEGVQGFTDKVETMRKALIQAAAGQGKAAGVLESYGLSAQKLSQMAPEQAMERLSDFMRQMPADADRARLAIALFGSEGQDMARVMSELGSEGIQSLREEARLTGSIMSDELTKQAEKYEDAKAKLGATVDGIKVRIFGPLLPRITGIFDRISERIMGSGGDITSIGERIAEKFDEILPKVIELAEKVGDFIAVVWNGVNAVVEFLGGWDNVIASLGIVVGVFAAFKAGMAIFAIATNPALLIVLALVAAIALIRKNWDKIAPVIMPVLDKMKDGFARVREIAIPIMDKIKEGFALVKEIAIPVLTRIKDDFIRVATTAMGVIGPMWEFIKAVFENIYKKVEPFLPLVRDIFGGAWEAVKFVWDVAVSWFDAVLNNIKEVFNLGTALLSGDFSAAWDAVKAIWDNCVEWFKGLFDKIWNALPDGVKDAIDNVLEFFKPLTDLIEKIAGFFGGIGEKVSGAFGTVKDKVGGFFGGMFDRQKEAAASVGAFVPGFASGGFVQRPTLANVAENVPEWIIPQDGSKKAFDLWQSAGQQFKEMLSDSAGGTTPNVNMPQGSSVSPWSIGRLQGVSGASASIVINYSPVNNFSGTSEEMQAAVMQQQAVHSDDLESRLRDLQLQQRRLRFA